MEEFLTLLPTVFCYWTGMLIAWSAVTVIGLILTIRKIKEKGLIVRKSDKMALMASFVGGCLLAVSMFLFSDFISGIVDAMIIVDLWYTVFLAYVSGSSLAGWPIVHFSPAPRAVAHRISED